MKDFQQTGTCVNGRAPLWERANISNPSKCMQGFTSCYDIFYSNQALPQELLECRFCRCRRRPSFFFTGIPQFRARSSWMAAKSFLCLFKFSNCASNSSFSLMFPRLGTNLNLGYFLRFFFRCRLALGL